MPPQEQGTMGTKIQNRIQRGKCTKIEIFEKNGTAEENTIQMKSKLAQKMLS